MNREEITNARDSLDQSDQDDLERLRSGDRLAFRRIVERHQDRLHNLVWRILQDREDAREVAQDAFLRAHEKLHQYRPEHRFRNWLYRIAQNLAISRLRRRGARSDPAADPAAHASPSPGPDEQAGRRDLLQRVDRCIAVLPEKYRSVLLLRHQESCSLAEIAYILELPVGTIKFRLHHGYGLLRGRLGLAGSGGED